MPWIIERNADAGGVYFSLSERGHHPTHSWGDKIHATQFGREKDATDFAGIFLRGEMASGDIRFKELT